MSLPSRQLLLASAVAGGHCWVGNKACEKILECQGSVPLAESSVSGLLKPLPHQNCMVIKVYYSIVVIQYQPLKFCDTYIDLFRLRILTLLELVCRINLVWSWLLEERVNFVYICKATGGNTPVGLYINYSSTPCPRGFPRGGL